jgi:hypothetical protein
MSNMQGISYLSDLLKKASEFRTRQLEIDRKKTLASMSTREPNARQTRLIPKTKPIGEYNLPQKRIAGAEITNIYQAAQQFNPFETNKTEEQLKEPLTYFDNLSKKVSTSYLEQQKPLVEQREALIQKRNKELEGIPDSISYRKPGRGGSFSAPNPTRIRIAREYQKKLEPIEQQISRLGTINTSIYGSQTKTLGELSNELKKYYGQNFENISKEQLAAADLSGFQSLTGDIEKYTSLRDSYIKKYQQTGSKVDMDWIKQYNDLLTDTSKSISSELPKIFASASNAVSSIKESQNSTLSALEALNRAAGVQQSSKERPPAQTDISNISRQQAISRSQRLQQYGEASKPSPVFKPRPV